MDSVFLIICCNISHKGTKLTKGISQKGSESAEEWRRTTKDAGRL